MLLGKIDQVQNDKDASDRRVRVLQIEREVLAAALHRRTPTVQMNLTELLCDPEVQSLVSLNIQLTRVEEARRC